MCKIFLGTSGYYYGHWIGVFYPPELDKKEWLKFYNNYFNTVEINSSFYRFPFQGMLKGWYNKTKNDFKITLKANKQITHTRKLKNIDDLLERFYKLSAILNEKVGCILFQTPPSMKKNLELIESFLKKLNHNFNNVIEFRHKSWYCDEVYDLLRKYNVGYAIISAPGFPTHIIATSNIAYIRWHGKENWYADNYTSEELKQWAEEIKKLSANCSEIYGYFNNDAYGYAPKNCLELKNYLT